MSTSPQANPAVERCPQSALTILAASGRLVARGDIDVFSAPLLDEALDRCRGDVVLDLANIAFVDCAGVASLVAGRRRLEASGGSLRIVRPSLPVRRLLTLTGTATLLMIEGRLDEASPISA